MLRGRVSFSLSVQYLTREKTCKSVQLFKLNINVYLSNKIPALPPPFLSPLSLYNVVTIIVERVRSREYKSHHEIDTKKQNYHIIIFSTCQRAMYTAVKPLGWQLLTNDNYTYIYKKCDQKLLDNIYINKDNKNLIMFFDKLISNKE